ncbi:unnamed protein product [Moneuplotes crassus]|uniref:Protein kinase domain-containing protein n=1 Tax=Euplotes crassus TaxID=5936 RepID=A0AAD2D9G6_EUPCR|nr:unnamed protein product [Moneuplotes crassus]
MDYQDGLPDLNISCLEKGKKLYIIENKMNCLNYTTASLPSNNHGFETLKTIIHEELGLKGEFDLYNKNGNKMKIDDFSFTTDNDIIYVRASGEFCYKAMLSLYRSVEKLGEGGFGSVFLLQHSLSEERVAAKFVDVSEHLQKANEIGKAVKESTSLISLDHDAIIKLETAFFINTGMVLFTEYIQGGELGKYVFSNEINEELAKKIFIKILDAVHYCHTRGIIHRDLKMENILLTDPNDPLSLRVIDFGISGICTHGRKESSTAGTLLYCPPEILDKSDIESDPKIDVWALGVILYIILLKRYPFRSKGNNKETRKLILNKELTFESRDEMKLSTSVKHLISNLLAKKKSRRYSIREIISHPWLLSDKEQMQNSQLAKQVSCLATDAIMEEMKSVIYPTYEGKDDDIAKYSGKTAKSKAAVSRNNHKNQRQDAKILSPLRVKKKLNDSEFKAIRGSKIKLRMNNPPGSILEPMKLKINSQSYLSAKKKRRKGGRSHKKSALISKFQSNRKESKSYLVGMEYCLFKREVEDDKILQEFLIKHSLECTESNVNTLREFAESSIESPIDFKSLIIRMKKKSRRGTHNDSFVLHHISTIEKSSLFENGPSDVYRDENQQHNFSQIYYKRSLTNKKKFVERPGDISMRKRIIEKSFSSAQKEGKKLSKKVSFDKGLLRKNSQIELPSIERREQSFRRENQLKMRRDKSFGRGSEIRNSDPFILKNTFVKADNLRRKRTFRKDDIRETNSTILSNKHAKKSTRKKIKRTSSNILGGNIL